MKGGLNLRVIQQEQKRKDEDNWVMPRPCMICNKMLKGAYGNWGDLGWTCSGACERIQSAKPRYPGHTEEDFFNRLGEQHDHAVSVEQGEGTTHVVPLVLRGGVLLAVPEGAECQ